MSGLEACDECCGIVSAICGYIYNKVALTTDINSSNVDQFT